MFHCDRCKADPQPDCFGSPRSCAFNELGAFTPDNWNCATVEHLLSFDDVTTVYGDDSSLNVIAAIHIEDEIEGQDDVATGGFLVFTRYKRRGRTSGAVFCGDFYPHLPVTLDLVNRVIAAWEEVYRRAKSHE